MKDLKLYNPGALPPTGHIRLSTLLGVKPVSAEEAAANQRRGRSPTKPRAGTMAIVPVGRATLWRMVKRGDFPKPVKLSKRVTAWTVESILAWIQAQQPTADRTTLASVDEGDRRGRAAR